MLMSAYSNLHPLSGFLTQGNKKKSQGARSGTQEDVKGSPSPRPAANPEHQDGNEALHCAEARHNAAATV